MTVGFRTKVFAASLGVAAAALALATAITAWELLFDRLGPRWVVWSAAAALARCYGTARR